MEWSRIRKPPGGGSNDIFHLEERQRFQENERHLSRVLQKEQDEFLKINIGDSRSIAPKVVAEYAGITDKTRVRKPPGGDTHDIFGLEKRQKSDALKRAYQNNVDSSIPQEGHCQDIVIESIYSIQRSLDEPMNPSCEQVKENINSLPEKRVLICGKQVDQSDDDNLKDTQSEDEADTKPLSKKFLRHNTITGEECELEVSMRPKLRDCSNVSTAPNHDQDPKEVQPQRSSVRIRHPPGGASSLIF